jgi:leader peptidase (prepilin peptidase)/N-methyltransferase
MPILFIWLGLLFLVGATAGSFLNVCIYRLPYEKSILWPLGSHCGRCFQPIRWYDNLPLVSYWVLRGRCRRCGARFSARYFLVELFTGLAFAGLFYLEVVRNVHGLAVLERQRDLIALGLVPGPAWWLFGYHALLVCFLIVVSMCDIDHMEIPLPVTITGTLVGLVGSALLPWPWPDTAVPLPRTLRVTVPGGTGAGLFVLTGPLPQGAYPWPLWYPLPAWLRPGTWQLGLATGLAGVLAGIVILRAVRFLFGLGRGKEGLGVGDADLMMMAGSFLGWQPVLVAFFVAVLPALVFGLGQLVLRGEQRLPFGPSLAIGVVLTMLGWRKLGPPFAQLFFDATWLIPLGIAGALFLLVASFMLRLVRGRGEPPQEPAGKAGP